MSAKVIVVPAAEAQARQIDEWWKENRPAAPDLFTDEFDSLLIDLADMPFIGRPYSNPTRKGVRRALLRHSQYYVYYVADPRHVAAVAIWGTERGRGPDLTGTLDTA